MFIHKIIIQGFKSYKEQTMIEPFSKKHNVVVGRNGSGKSNFFWAIRFVLGDSHNSMTREERQSLLHEGHGHATISAFVEIIFDNSDNRFPTGKEFVVLRRTIGLKKDEYSLDKKVVTKSEVMNLLESAGFSRSNPYYIVPQGRITSLVASKENERLLLLKEVAGTQVYEQRRLESVKIMQETNQKRSQIADLLEYIDERLVELEEEKKELDLYLEIDKDRRCLEYALYTKDQSDAIDQLEAIEIKRQEEQHEAIVRYKQLSDRQVMIQENMQELNAKKTELELKLIEKQQIQDDISENVSKRAKILLQIKDFTENLDSTATSRNEFLQEKINLETALNDSKRELATLTAQYNHLEGKEAKQGQEIFDLQTQLDSIVSKQGRFDRFKSAAQRDAWLKESIKEHEIGLKNLRNQSIQLTNTKEAAKNELQGLKMEQKKLNEELNSRTGKLLDIDHKFKELQRLKVDKDIERKNLWREEAKITSQLDSLKKTREEWQRALLSTMDRSTSKGLQSVSKIVERLNIKGYYGPLYTLFDVNENLSTAVEVIAGQALFHIVVENEVVAQTILKSLSQEGGRVTFMPINRIKPKDFTYPISSSLLKLIDRLEYDEKFANCMKQVFGRAMVASSLDVASKVAKEYELTCITFDGDRADRKGALTGGFTDARKTRMENIKSLLKTEQELASSEKNLADSKSKIRALDVELLSLRDSLSELDSQKRNILSQNTSIQLKNIMKRMQETETSLINHEKDLDTLGISIRNLENEIDNLSKELGTPFVKKLTPQEQKLNTIIPEQLQKAKEAYADIVTKRVQCETSKNMIENSIRSNLEPQLERIELKLLESAKLDDAGLFSLEEECQYIQTLLSSLTESLNQTVNVIDDLNDAIETHISRIEKQKTQLAEENAIIEKQQLIMQKLLTKKALYSQKKETALAHIRNLGVLPEEAFEKYQDSSSKQVFEHLIQILAALHVQNEKLKKYEHVNKKAHEQYANFTKQEEALLSRKEELDASAKSIEELIETLDERKNLAITQTFKQVAQHFKEIWSEIVPEGQGELVMIERNQEEFSQNQSNETVERYTGISLNVSFSAGKLQSLQQLSGGQKSLVALTLIFAIQKCDPAPFYLFDEIDAALDAQYRTKVAEMITKQKENAQFITTTFRKELLKDADAFYGVTFVNKVSKIQSIDRESAQEFVVSQAGEN